MNKNYSRLIFKNSTFNFLRYGVLLLVMLVITPFMVKKLGVPLYGIWALILAFSNLSLMMDLGLGAALNKFIPEFSVQGEAEKINRFINTALLCYAFLSGLIVLLLVIFQPWIITKLLKPQASQLNEVKLAYYLNLAVFFCGFLLLPYLTIITGLQRFDLFCWLGIIEALSRGFFIYLLLSLGWGLPGLVLSHLLATVFYFLAARFFIRKIFPAFKLLLPRLSAFKESGRKLLNFGLKIFISSLAGIFHFQLDKFLLGYFLTADYVSFYQLGGGLGRQFRAVPEQLVAPIFPLASELETLQDKARLEKLYFHSQKYNLIIIFPLFTLGFILSPTLIKLWLGEGFSLAALALQFLLVAYFFNLLTAPGFQILNGMGKAEIGMKSSLLGSLLNLGLSWLLIWKMGFAGALWGTTISMFLAMLYFKVMFHLNTSLSFARMLQRCFLVPAVAALLPVIFFKLFAHFSLLLPLLCYLVFYPAFLMLTRHIDEADKLFLRNILGRRGGGGGE